MVIMVVRILSWIIGSYKIAILRQTYTIQLQIHELGLFLLLVFYCELMQNGKDLLGGP